MALCCSVKRIPSPIPDKAWYLTPQAIAVVGGLLPFGSIFIEMYFIFTSFWNYKVRFAHGIQAYEMPCALNGSLGRLPAAPFLQLSYSLPPFAFSFAACPWQVYYVYGFFLLVFLILLIVTVRARCACCASAACCARCVLAACVCAAALCWACCRLLRCPLRRLTLRSST